MNTSQTKVGQHAINGMIIDIVMVEPTTDVRFLSQRQLRAMRTPEALAELDRRAAIVAGR